MLFNFHIYVNISVFLLVLISSFIPLWSEKICYDFSLFKFIETCFVVLHMVWRMFHLHLRRMYILLLLIRLFYTCLLGLVGVFRVMIKSTYFLFNLSKCSVITESGVFKYPPIVELSVSPFISATDCFIYLWALYFGAYMFMIVISS